MPRLVGLAYASKMYREVDSLKELGRSFSNNGNEVAFGTIGNASCAEGVFWESVNAVGVLQVPLLLSIWDDGFRHIRPQRFSDDKRGYRSDSGRLSSPARRSAGTRHPCRERMGLPRALCHLPGSVQKYREEHVPAIIHVTELTQPLGHSTSETMSATKRRTAGLGKRARLPVQDAGVDSRKGLRDLQRNSTRLKTSRIRTSRRHATRRGSNSGSDRNEQRAVLSMAQALEAESAHPERLAGLRQSLEGIPLPHRRDIMATVTEILLTVKDEALDTGTLRKWKGEQDLLNQRRYGSDLYSETSESALIVPIVPARYSDEPKVLKGFEIIQTCMDAAFSRFPNLIALGEDVGFLGGVNQGWAHLQEKYGPARITDTGIREATIVGQAIGMALRGLRPIAEIQYLDYILYALQIISDDLASLRWRTRGGQKAPVIIKTRGHRLEGIWHSGSPMAGIIDLVRGIYVCVPRNSVQAAGFYNTILRSDDAALVVEV